MCRLDVPLRECGAGVLTRDLDVLFVVQSYGLNIAPRVAATDAARALPERLRAVTSGTIRFAALTGDAGPGDIIGNGCELVGRDGVLVSSASGATVATLLPGEPTGPFIDEALAILERVRQDECVNQLLESTARALTPSTVPLTLPAHGSLHGDRETAALLHPGDLLLVVFISDAEDCSWNERVTTGLPARIVPCPRTDTEPWTRCCPEVLYPAAARYVPALRAAAAAQDVDLAFALISSLPEADVSLAEWRARGEPERCYPGTPDIYAHMPWRMLEVLDCFEPFVTTQPRCDTDYDAIADVVAALGCASD